MTLSNSPIEEVFNQIIMHQLPLLIIVRVKVAQIPNTRRILSLFLIGESFPNSQAIRPFFMGNEK